MPFEQVADDRARQHPDRAGADALKKPEGKQRVDRRRERAARGAKREEEDPGQHHRLAAEAVGERADDERRGREAGEKDGDGGRGLRLGGAEIGLEEPEARQRHVDRQRRQRGQGGQKRREAKSVNVEAHQVWPARASHRRRIAAKMHPSGAVSVAKKQMTNEPVTLTISASIGKVSLICRAEQPESR